MENLNMDQFSPKKAELIQLADKYSGLEIKGINDREGYEIIDEARKDLKVKRVEIQKTGKSLRSEALQFQKAVIQLEKDLVGIIKPIEQDLIQKQDKIKEEKTILKRRRLLPERREKLAELGLDISDNDLLKMDPSEFMEFWNIKRAEQLDEKEKRLKEEQEKADRAKEIEEAKKQARLDAEKEAEQKAERRAKEAEDLRLSELAKNQRIADQKEADKQAQIKAEKEEAEKLIKREDYKKFLEENGYTNETKPQFHVVKTEKELILYKEVSRFQYN